MEEFDRECLNPLPQISVEVSTNFPKGIYTVSHHTCIANLPINIKIIILKTRISITTSKSTAVWCNITFEVPAVGMPPRPNKTKPRPKLEYFGFVMRSLGYGLGIRVLDLVFVHVLY